MSLLNKISSDTTLNKKVTEELFIRIFDVIKDLIINREEVVIDNFGSFKVERRKIQTMVDYNRKVVVLLPPKDKIIFSYTNGSTRGIPPVQKTTVFSSRKIVNIVSESSGVDEIAVYEFYNILFEVIREYLDGKRNINIIEFGKFKVNRNDKISFSPAKKFSDKVNYNFNNLKAQIIRSLNRDEIKKLYREKPKYAEDEDLQPDETIEVEEQLTVGKEEEAIIKIEKPVEKEPPKKDYTPPSIVKEGSLKTTDVFEDKVKTQKEIQDEEPQLKERIESDFSIIEEMFKEDTVDMPREIFKETDLDIILMQDTEEAVEPVTGEKPVSEIAAPPPLDKVITPEVKTLPPVEKEIKPVIPEITEKEIKEELSVKHPYYTPTADSPATEKILSDFEDKVKSFLKQAAEERESYEKELTGVKPPEKEITLQDMTGIPEPPAKEIIEKEKPEASLVTALDKIIKDDEDDIEIAEIKTSEDFVIPEKLKDIPESIIKEDEIESAGITGLKDTVLIPKPPAEVKIPETAEDFVIPEKLKDIPESIIKEDEIESAGITGLKDTVILPVPPAESPAEIEIAETEEDNIPISEVYRKLKDSYMEEADGKISEEPKEIEPVIAGKSENITIPEIEKSSVTLQQEKDTVSGEIKEAVFKDIKLSEPEIKLPEAEIKLPEAEIKLPEAEIKLPPPVIKFTDTEKDFKLKEVDSYTEGLTYEDKKKEFEKIMQKYSDEFNADEITKKDIEDIKASEIIPPISKPVEKEPELPFKSLDENVIQPEKDDTLEDLKSYINKIGEKKSPEPEQKTTEDDSLPFKKVEDIDLPKSIDDYFEEIEEEFKKRKQNKNKDKQ